MEEKFYTEASGPSNELVYNSPKGLKVISLYVLNDLACQRRPLFRLVFQSLRKKALVIPSWETISVTSVFFNQS